MSHIYFTGDTHYGHIAIIKKFSTWASGGLRDFESVEHMNQVMVDNINKVVGKRDILYHLGDWSMGGFKNVKEFRDRIQCQSVTLIIGNHDPMILKNKDGIRGVFSKVMQLNNRKIGGQAMALSHFPQLVWHRHYHGAWHLHGHCHGSLNNPEYYKRKVMDVGVDCHPEFRPFAFEEIKEIMDAKETRIIDSQ